MWGWCDGRRSSRSAIAGLVIGARRGWPHARIGLVVVGLQVYMVSSWFFLSQGHTFGNRMLVNCTVFSRWDWRRFSRPRLDARNCV